MDAGELIGTRTAVGAGSRATFNLSGRKPHWGGLPRRLVYLQLQIAKCAGNVAKPRYHRPLLIYRCLGYVILKKNKTNKTVSAFL